VKSPTDEIRDGQTINDGKPGTEDKKD
jgi:hypothetical protein